MLIKQKRYPPISYLCLALLNVSLISVGERGVEVGVQYVEAHPALLIFDIALKANDIYEAYQPDELSGVSRRLIEKTLKAQSEAGFIPLSSLSAQDREVLGARGRLELGIDQLAKHLDAWGDQLLQGQGKLSTQLNELAKENREGHALTQQLLGHMTRAELNTGLRNLSDGLQLLKQNPDDLIARHTINDAKSALIKHVEFLKQEELVGRSSSVEHWAILRVSLASAYLGVGLGSQALRELTELMRLPIDAHGLTRLREKLPEQARQAKLAFFNEPSQRLKKRANGLTRAHVQLGAWLEALKGERQRLEKLKRQAVEVLKANASISSSWLKAFHDAQREAQKLEDEKALCALMLLSNQMSPSMMVDWVKIPGGSFDMGSNDFFGHEEDEEPVHRVQMGSFLMSKTEVTVGQYRKCVESGQCSEPNTGGACNWSKSGRDDHPVNCIDWGQARTFAKWVGTDVDLPTEAEWEYAARGGQSFIGAGSNDPNEVAWYNLNSGHSTHRVGTKKANGYGLHDMSGNVSEWTLDEYKDSYVDAPSDGSQMRGTIPVCKVTCDKGSALRVIRGGCWDCDIDDLRVTNRDTFFSAEREDEFGFRLRRTIP